jgi:hypothetical protein
LGAKQDFSLNILAAKQDFCSKHVQIIRQEERLMFKHFGFKASLFSNNLDGKKEFYSNMLDTKKDFF